MAYDGGNVKVSAGDSQKGLGGGIILSSGHGNSQGGSA